jgi:hypothetical protein
LSAKKLVLVEKKPSYTWIYNHKKTLSTWRYADLVEEFDFLTLKQALRIIAGAEWGLFFLLSCGTLKTAART